jgi:hypothetical protein
MAKARTVIRTVGVPVRAAAPIVIRAPSMPRASRARRAGAAARRYGGAAYSQAKQEKHTLTALAAAAVLAIAERNGYGTILGFPTDVAGGLVAWAGGRMTKNVVAQHAATGLLSIAIHRMVTKGSVVGEGVLGEGRAAVWDE